MWACGAVRGLAGDPEIGRVQAPAAWITAQFRFSVFELEGREGKRNERRAPDAVVSLAGPKGAVPGKGPPPERK